MSGSCGGAATPSADAFDVCAGAASGVASPTGRELGAPERCELGRVPEGSTLAPLPPVGGGRDGSTASSDSGVPSTSPLEGGSVAGLGRDGACLGPGSTVVETAPSASGAGSGARPKNHTHDAATTRSTTASA